MLNKIGPIDAVLASGDVSDDGSAESYQRFQQMIAPLGVPLFVIPGNHDLREPMRSAFEASAYLPGAGKLNWHQSVGSIDVIGLDTLIEGTGKGELDADTLMFLSAALGMAGERPVLLALHHPPFQCGIKFMDELGLQGSHALSQILAQHSGHVRIVCGHIHSTMVVDVGGKVAISAPSPCSSFAYNTRPDADIGFFES